MLTTENTILLVIDVQGNLARQMYAKETLFENISKAIKGTQILDVPIVLTEQYPEGLGPTIPEIAGLFAEPDPISKISFSCCGEDRFMQTINRLQPDHILVAGIETHVCVYQTVRDLLEAKFAVQIIADAVSSRTRSDRKIGLKKIRDAGAAITSVETALFEMLQVAKGDQFKKMLDVVK